MAQSKVSFMVFVFAAFLFALLSLTLPYISNRNITHLLLTATQVLPLLNETSFAAFISSYLLMHLFISKLFLQADIKWNALKKCTDNIIENTVWQTIILWMICVNISANDRNNSPFFLYLWLFAIGRILFSIGYLLGTKLKMQILRSPGFAISFGAEFGLLFLAINPNILRHYVNY